MDFRFGAYFPTFCHCISLTLYPLPLDVMNVQTQNMPQFNLLVGIALSRQQTDFCGQFTFWPGVTICIHVFVQLHRPLFIALAQTHHKVQRKMIAAEGYEGFWQQNHRPEYREEWDVQSVQCKVDIGDIVIAHPFLAHKGGLNYSPDNRYMCYFRVKSKGFQQMSQDDRIQNLWIGMNGMRDVLNGSNGGSADEEQ